MQKDANTLVCWSVWFSIVISYLSQWTSDLACQHSPHSSNLAFLHCAFNPTIRSHFLVNNISSSLMFTPSKQSVAVIRPEGIMNSVNYTFFPMSASRWQNSQIHSSFEIILEVPSVLLCGRYKNDRHCAHLHYQLS